jgi:uncharacterized membrane protein
VAVGLGTGLPAVDGILQAGGGEEPLRFVFGGGPSAARDLLAAIAGSLISVTGLTFSFTVVALQLASSQHSPRFLQTFVTDRVVQATLAQLVGTFTYALTVLRTVRSEDSTADETAFVPRLSVTVGFVLAVFSVIALVLFLGHLARSLRVETMLRDVSTEARDAYERLLPADQEPGRVRPVDHPQGVPRVVVAESSGFVVDVDADPIVRAAHEADVTIRLVPRIGDSLVTGTPVAHVWPPAMAVGVPAVDLGGVDRSLQRHVRLEFERAPSRDVGYSLRKVVDIAVRALSPGTNDPTTAVHAMSHVSALLGELLERPPAPLQFRDDDGVLRLVVLQWDAAALIQLGLEEPLAFASGQPAVLRRIAKLLQELAWRTARGPAVAILRAHLTRAIDLAADSTSVSRGEIDTWQRRFDDALTGKWDAEV